MDYLWRIEILGELRAVGVDRVLTRFRSHKAGALLAYLAFYRDRAHPRELLTDLLWPDEPPEPARMKLRTALSSLRRQLEPPGITPGSVILADRRSVQLNPAAVTTDTAEFEAALQAAAQAGGSGERAGSLAAAIGLYRGPLLPGYYEAWILPEQQRLSDLFHQAVRQMIGHLEQAGHLDRAIEYAERAVAADPHREEAHIELIRLYAAAGQPASALRQYRELERLLEEEFGEAPSPETQALVEWLRRQNGVEASRGDVVRLTDAAPPRSPATALIPDGGLLTDTRTFLLALIDPAAAPGQYSEQRVAKAATGAAALLRREFQRHGGLEIQAAAAEIGAAAEALLVAMFDTASEALAAALEGQRAALGWSACADTRSDRPVAPARVHSPTLQARMALHTGDAAIDGEVYRGPALQHAVRLLAAAEGGQILCSAVTAGLLRSEASQSLGAGVELSDLGMRHLAGMARPERLFQIADTQQAPREPPSPPPGVSAGRLPLQVNRFFGREAEIDRLRDLLLQDKARLVTLTGPGGSGKTRLALELAAQIQEALRGAVWFVPLVDLADPQWIADALRDVLRLPRLPHREPIEQVVEAVSRRPSLLVLDNFEQLMPEGVPVVRDLLERAPLLQCLITSRQILELTPEREIAVGPLPVPDARRLTPGAWRGRGADGEPASNPSELASDVSRLASVESVALFLDRAQRVRPHFQLTRGNAATVAELCRRLEGIPLAIELAAARTRELSPARMLGQIERRLDLLVSRKRDLPSRHQTLRAAIDWSYQPLPLELQRFFARLFVFRGGFTVEAAAAVAGDEHADSRLAQEYLARLQGSSLVRTVGTGEETRFHLLETLREYAAEQLSPEERAQVAQRHAEYYQMWVEAAQPKLRHGPQQNYWLDRLEVEHENLRAALDWAEETGALERAFQLVALLEPFWEVRSHLTEGQQRMTRLLGLAGATIPEVRRASMLNSIGWFTHRRGAYAAAVPLHEQALEIARRLGDRHEIADSLRNLGAIASKEGNGELARLYLEESLAINEALGDERGTAASMGTLGLSLVYSGDYNRARRLIEQALRLVQELALNQQSGPSFAIAANLNNLGFALLRQGYLDEARSLLVQSLRLKEELGNADGIPYGLEGLAELAAERGQWARAVRLLAAADAAREVGGHPRCPPSECAICERLLALAREALGAEAFTAAWIEGHGWSVEQKVAYAAQEAEPASSAG